MRLMSIGLCAAAVVCSASLSAQSSETRTKTKISIEDGKSATVTGCVAAAGGGGYVLTNAADKQGVLHNYTLVSDDDLSKHVGHLVQIRGTVTDRGDAKVKTDTRTTTKVEHGDDKDTRRKTEIEGDVATPYFGVKSVKMIAAACP